MPEDSTEDPASTQSVSEAAAFDIPPSSIPTEQAGKFTYHTLRAPISLYTTCHMHLILDLKLSRKREREISLEPQTPQKEAIVSDIAVLQIQL
jgi:hypothetical protein